MSKKSFRIALGIVAGSLVIAALVGGYFVREALRYPARAHVGTGQVVEVEIEPGMSFPAIAKRLHKAGIIDKPLWFRIYAMRRGATTKVRIGKYSMRDDQTPEKVLDTLLAGVPDVTVAITVPEGLNLLEVFARIESKGIAAAAELEQLCRDPEFLQKHGIEGETCEGYLFPSTYDFRVPSEPAAVLDRLFKQHRVVWARIRNRYPKQLARVKKKLGWTDRDVLIMASIVEKEAVVDSERPRIAQVFMNRLLSPKFVPHRLDTDPTIRYGCTVPVNKSAACQQWDVTDRLHRIQLDDTYNTYNTYQHEGLPPGPIGNPGERSLMATVNPDGTNYFFFVSRNDGTHVFSRTRGEHNTAVNKYQR